MEVPEVAVVLPATQFAAAEFAQPRTVGDDGAVAGQSPHTVPGLGVDREEQVARRLPALWLRRLVVAVGASLSLIYFIKTYF